MSEPVGVILLNLGGPETLADVEPFLVNLFSDREIIRLSPFPFLQKFIARRIAAKRAPKSREAYRLIGGGSPLTRITGEQGGRWKRRWLQTAISWCAWPCVTGGPGLRMAWRNLPGPGCAGLVALTLYPHYSKATTGSSLDALRKAVAASGPAFELAEVREWPEQPEYVACLAQSIREGMAGFGGEPVQLVYSAHSLPVSFIREGDPIWIRSNGPSPPWKRSPAWPGGCVSRAAAGRWSGFPPPPRRCWSSWLPRAAGMF